MLWKKSRKEKKEGSFTSECSSTRRRFFTEERWWVTHLGDRFKAPRIPLSADSSHELAFPPLVGRPDDVFIFCQPSVLGFFHHLLIFFFI
ncbi:hypothetical protein CDAR_273141 [Caerostris darwini]|uniref:Uncharacterized protein n=1 Tax=Caerostris darwini TaxID=1538125 RepID=A0AAV4MFK1_9ARAC|nr:hypothetical protein CDAR_273141 [Caerostris darwini]